MTTYVRRECWDGAGGWGWGRNKGVRKQRERGEREGRGRADSSIKRRAVNSADGEPYHARRWLMLSAKWKGIRGKTEREREVREGREFSGECDAEKKKKEEGGGRKEGWWSCVSPRLADEMLRAGERSLSPATTNRARALMGAAAIKMRGEGGREGERERREKRGEKNETTPQWYKSPRGGYQGRRQSL